MVDPGLPQDPKDLQDALLGGIMVRAQILEDIGRASSKVVDIHYEFADNPDLLPEAVSEHLDHLDTLLVEAGFRVVPEPPPPHVPTNDQVDQWIKDRIAENQNRPER